MSANPPRAPIDAVITWVDGSDPGHAAQLAHYLAGLGGARPAAAQPTRFGDDGEIDWCVASILRFAPWIRTIHIVTASQTPSLVERLRGTPQAGRVRVVDHREIFAGHEQHLPTFNSRAIITALWRIQGLAEHYIYFNDDFVLLQRLAPEDFFRDGRVVARGAWHPQTRHRPARRLLTALRRRLPNDPALARAGDLAAQELSARLAGFDQRFLRMEHNPFPQRRQTLERFFQQHPDLLEHNLAFRLRSSQQFKTEVLATHLELANGSALLDKRLRTLQLKPAEQWLPRLQAKVARADRDPRYAFACVQSLDLAPPRARACITEWLQQRVGSLVEAARAGGP
ncbi:MAG TPA: Stealth CR1 domain-containing protein [Rubrivivax sp.]|nr:Stealth CR1 domain-containing protein [Rubrivivax sp.]